MTVTIGIDPGQAGAIAILGHDGELADVHDMPVVGNDVSPRLLDEIIARWSVNAPVVVVEEVHSMPKQGVASSFKFGKSYGIVLGVVAASCYRVEHVTPARWKRDMRVTADKESSRSKAIERWPAWSKSFALKKHADRAEAALIALWYHERLERS